MNFLNKHYIRIDEQNNITHGFSDAFEQPQGSDILINDLGGRHFELFGQINPSIQNEQGVYLYRYSDGVILHKTSE